MTTKSLLTMAESVNNVFTEAVRHLPRPHSDPIGRGIHEPPRLMHALASRRPELSRVLASGSEFHTKAMMVHFHFLARWRSLGFPVFKVTSDLLAALALTDCRDLRVDDLGFPFESFVIELPRDCFLSLTGSDGSEAPITNVIFHAFDSIDSSSAAGDVRSRICVGTAPTNNETVNAFYTMPLPGERIESLFVSNNSPPREYVGDIADRFDSGDRFSQQAMMRIVINLCLYLASLPTRQWEKHSGRIRYNQKNRPEVTEWAVGREIKLPRTLIDAAKAFAADGKDRSAWRVKSRFIVRGHWRMQACGKELSERKKIWIQPFEKGPVDAAMLTRRYQVDTTTNEGVTT